MSKVFARRGLPRGRLSRTFQASDLKDLDIFNKEKVYLDLDEHGFLIPADSNGGELPPNVYTRCSLAGDIQNRNIELQVEEELLSLRLLKDVAPDNSLELWFSEELIARINMPFLTPKNIRGRKNYICHECGVQFEQPNPLKIHMFLSCQDFSISKFWRKFLAKLKEESLPLNLSLDSFSRNLHFERPKSQENSQKYSRNILRPNSEPPSSAFKPYKFGPELYSQFNNNTSILSRFYPTNLSLHPAYSLHSDLISNQALKNWHIGNVDSVSKSLDRVSLTNPAEIEALATNWGKSKEGHLCLYCGKVYSRKYGLKIHIRTHTGYKPLQCKYCLRPFGDPSNLNKHVRLHAQCETPYSCNLCGKMLVRKRDLERHLRSRHGDDEHNTAITNIDRDTPTP